MTRLEAIAALCRDLHFRYEKSRRFVWLHPDRLAEPTIQFAGEEAAFNFLMGVQLGMRLHEPGCRCGRVACNETKRSHPHEPL